MGRDVVILGLSSRSQSTVSGKLYDALLNCLSGVYDLDLGTITSIDELRRMRREISQSKMAIIVVLSGGTSRLIRDAAAMAGSIHLITHGTQNSLASALHALYGLSKQHKSHIWHTHISGSDNMDVARRNTIIVKRLTGMHGSKLVLIGVDEDYVEREFYNIDRLKGLWGIEVELVPMDKVLEVYEEERARGRIIDKVRRLLTGGYKGYAGEISALYLTMRRLMSGAVGGGVRCFPLIKRLRITPCVVVSMLIDEDIPFACEADLASLATMVMVKNVTGLQPFMANVVDFSDGRITIAHCTIALSLTQEYRLVSHFETGSPVSIEGLLKEGNVTLAKVSPDFEKFFVVEGRVVQSGKISEEICRTQAIVEIEGASRFLTGEFSHHILLVYGRHGEVLAKAARFLGMEVVDV